MSEDRIEIPAPTVDYGTQDGLQLRVSPDGEMATLSRRGQFIALEYWEARDLVGDLALMARWLSHRKGLQGKA
jgi:hypothetical protein